MGASPNDRSGAARTARTNLAGVAPERYRRSSDALDKLQRVTGCGVEKDPTLRLIADSVLMENGMSGIVGLC
jgi:hypothetical protein